MLRRDIYPALRVLLVSPSLLGSRVAASSALPALFSLSSLMCDLIPCMCVALVVCATSVCCSVVSSRRGWQYRLWHAACVHRGRPATQHHCMVPVDVEYVSRVVACGRNFYIRTLMNKIKNAVNSAFSDFHINLK